MELSLPKHNYKKKVYMVSSGFIKYANKGMRYV